MSDPMFYPWDLMQEMDTQTENGQIILPSEKSRVFTKKGNKYWVDKNNRCYPQTVPDEL